MQLAQKAEGTPQALFGPSTLDYSGSIAIPEVKHALLINVKINKWK